MHIRKEKLLKKVGLVENYLNYISIIVGKEKINSLKKVRLLSIKRNNKLKNFTPYNVCAHTKMKNC